MIRDDEDIRFASGLEARYIIACEGTRRAARAGSPAPAQHRPPNPEPTAP